MGVGRRMIKQGPPEPLSEAHFARLKRKAGIPVEEAVEAPDWKKRRTNKQAQKPKGKPAAQTKEKAKKGAVNGIKPAAPAVQANGKTNPRSKPRPGKKVVEEIPSDVDDSDSQLDDDDEFSDLDEEEEVAKLGDDFLGSDDSVYDSDQEQEQQSKHMFSEDEDDSEGEEALTAANIEGLSKKLAQEAEEEAADAQAELEEMGMATNIEGDKPHILDDDDEDAEGKPQITRLAPDLHMLRNRITENIRVLEDFTTLAEEGRARSEYTSQLIKDISLYLGYSEFLAEKLFSLFSPREAWSFFEASESARPVVLRTNTLRTSRRELASALIQRGCVVEPCGKWTKVGLQVFESPVPLGATPEYLAGHYILMAASSFLPVMALDPQPGERVLDMASAPGGKATFMSAMMKNKGLIVANDPNKARAKGLIGNIHRLGCKNVIVSNYDAREFPKPLGGFDRVLLDAPCSGTGVIAKDASVKTNKTELDFIRLPHLQKQLLLAAIDSVNHNSKTGGYVCYSTCSVSIEENEQVVNYALSRRPNVRLVETGLTFGREGFISFQGKQFDPSLRHTRRYYPHSYNVDGFYVAKFQKFAPTPAKAVRGPADANATQGKSKKAAAAASDDDEEMVDRSLIGEDAEDKAKAGDDFGGFEEDEDEDYIERAKRNAMRRRGLDPHALEKSKGKAKKEAKKKEAEEEEKEEEPKAATVVKVDVVDPEVAEEDVPAKKNGVKGAKGTKASPAKASPGKADKAKKGKKKGGN